MTDTSRVTRQKSWQDGRQRVSVLAEMALRRERVVERLTELREQESLTQEQAAHRVGVTHRQWQRWEAGESMPYPRNLDLIASKFGITVAEFFDEPTLASEAQSQLDRIEAKLDQVIARLGEPVEVETAPELPDRPPLPSVSDRSTTPRTSMPERKPGRAPRRTSA